MVQKRFRSHVIYKTDSGIVCPGASTISGMLEKPALVHAAWKLGTEGKDYKKVWGAAADIGTIAHEMIECYIKGKAFDSAEYVKADVDKAENAYLAFLEFEKHLPKYRTAISEGIPMGNDEFFAKNVSEKYLYGGIIDWVIEIDETKELWMFDFKSAKAIYDEHIYQTSGYFNLFHECNPGKKLSRLYLLQLGKEDGTFQDHLIDTKKIEWAWGIFWHLLQIYWIKKR